MKKINKSKSGAIVFRKNENNKQILLLYRRKQNDWSFPKGHVEPDEDIESAMSREIMEETGLNVEIVKELPPMIYQKINDSITENITCHMYLVEPKSGELKIEHSQDELKWIDIDKVSATLSYQNLKEYFQSIIEQV